MLSGLLVNHIDYAFVMEDCMLMFITLQSDMLTFFSVLLKGAMNSSRYNYFEFLCYCFIFMAGDFREASTLEVNCISFCLFIHTRIDVWTLPAILLQGL